MEKATYFAVFEQAGPGYSVYFPDLPGCISVGDSFAEAQANAQEALGLHLWGLNDAGDAIPAPSALQDLEVPVSGAFVAISIFPALVQREMDNRTIRTNVTLPAWLKKAAEAEGLNYSQVLQAALQERLGI